MIDDDRTGDVMHHNVVELEVGHRQRDGVCLDIWFGLPCLDPDTVHPVDYGAVLHKNASNIPVSWLLPRLPVLMPCPGPQVTLDTVRLLVTDPIDMQSSPVPIWDSEMVVMFELHM